jgi:tetratricopeptide (TPR) repeat protein
MSDVSFRHHAWHIFLIAAVLSVAWGGWAQADTSPEERLQEASRNLASFNFSEAYRQFRPVTQAAQPGSVTWQKAMLGLAMSAQHITPANPVRIEEARQTYEQLASSASEPAIAAYAVIAMGRIAELRDFAGDPVDLDTARRFYQQAIDRWPDSETADEAALWLAGTYIQQYADAQQTRVGVRQLEAWLQRRPTNAFASAMWLYLGDAWFIRMNDRAKAVACYLKADELGIPVRATVGLLYWRLAVLAESLPDGLDTAIRYYQRIIQISPTSGRAFEAQQALERLRRQHPQRGIEIPQIQVFHISDSAQKEDR